MKPILAILFLACWFTQPARAGVSAPPPARGVAACDVEPLPPKYLPPWDRPGYVEPVWATELRALIDGALRKREGKR